MIRLQYISTIEPASPSGDKIETIKANLKTNK